MLKKYLDEEKYEELKNSSNVLYKALELVTILFENDIDKGGLPYILHLIYIYKHVYSEDEKIIALLHSVIEDKDVTANDLLDIGFSKKIVDDIVILSRKKHSDYKIYIDNLVKNASIEVLHVKLADLSNNMDMTRIKTPNVSDYERVNTRYKPAYEKILNRLKEMVK